MEIIVIIVMGLLAISIAIGMAIAMMVIITMLYHFFAVIIPIIAIVLFVCGILVGIWCAVKNTFIVYKVIYRKK